MRVTKNKLKDEYGALSSGMQSTNGGTNGTPAKAKATPRKRKSKGVGDDEESPTKKVKSKGSESPVKKDQVEGEETEDFFWLRLPARSGREDSGVCFRWWSSLWCQCFERWCYQCCGRWNDPLYQ